MASTLNTLRQEREDLRQEIALVTKQLNTVGAAAVRDNRKMTDAERKDFVALTERRDKLNDALATNSTALADAEARSEAVRQAPAGVDADAEASRRAVTRAGLPSGAPRARPTVSTGPKFAQMFPRLVLSSGGFEDCNQFLATIHAGRTDARLVPGYLATGHIGTVPSEGGFAVPPQFLAQWLDDSLEDEIVRPRAFIQPMTSDTAHAPGFDGANRGDGTLFGGFAGGWVGEGVPLTEQQTKLRLITLRARKLGIFTKASNELVADGVSFEVQLSRAIVKAIGWFLDTAFLTGDGSNKPLGVLSAPCTIDVTRATAATILYDDLANMFARMAPSSLANAIWVCTQTAIPKLLQLSVAVGTGGSHVPVLTESNGEFRILTRPVRFTEKLPALGTRGDILFADFSKYVVGLRKDATLEKSGHAGFQSDSTYYRGILRADGQPQLATAITPDNGDTISPFVTLAA